MTDPKAESDALAQAADFIEATSGIGARTSDYADGWYDGLDYAIGELRNRAAAIPPAGAIRHVVTEGSDVQHTCRDLGCEGLPTTDQSTPPEQRERST